MATSNYCVTSRIANKTVGGKTYDERRQQLIDNVYSENGYWDETTSFIFVSSELDTPTFTKKACQGLSPADDLVVVLDPTDMSACYFGPLKHVEVLQSFLPELKKSP
jgi:hypothetical protein